MVKGFSNYWPSIFTYKLNGSSGSSGSSPLTASLSSSSSLPTFLLFSFFAVVGIVGSSSLYGLYLVYIEKKKLENKQTLEVVGGHSTKQEHKQDESHTILIIHDKVYKPFQAASKGKKLSRGDAEAEFYKLVNELKHPIKAYLPGFFGIDQLDGRTYLVLQDITNGFRKPCLLDIKMGRRTYDEEATPEKIEKEKKKYPPQEIIGFRFSGMKTYMATTNETFESTREWCLSLQPGDIPNALEKFFYDGIDVRTGLIESLIDELSQITKCLEKYPKWRFYGSSLLIAYDGEKPALTSNLLQASSSPSSMLQKINEEDNILKSQKSQSLPKKIISLERSTSSTSNASNVSRNKKNKLQRKESLFDLNSHHYHDIRVKMIDFTHVFEIKDGGKDYGYLHGLHFLISCLNELLDRNRPQAIQRSKKSRLNSELLTLSLNRQSNDGFNDASSTATDGTEMDNINDNRSSYSLENSKNMLIPLLPTPTLTAASAPEITASYQEPTGATLVADQIGGAHGNIKMTNETISKIEDSKETFDTEAEFYEIVTKENDPLINVMPKLIKVDREANPRVLVLENASALVMKPKQRKLARPKLSFSTAYKDSRSSISPSNRSVERFDFTTDTSSITRHSTLGISISSATAGRSFANNLGISNSASPRKASRSLGPARNQKIEQVSSDIAKSKPLAFSPSIRSPSPSTQNEYPTPRLQLSPMSLQAQPSPRKGSVSSMGSSQSLNVKMENCQSEQQPLIIKPSIMDCKIGFRSFRNDAPNNPENSYYKKYSTFEKELPEGLVPKIWESIPEISNPNGPSCLKDGKLGKRDYLSFRDASTTSLKHG